MPVQENTYPDRYLPPPAVINWLLEQEWSTAIDLSKNCAQGGVGRFIFAAGVSGHEALPVLCASEYGRIELTSRALQILRRKADAAERNSRWVRHRLPTSADTRDGLVLIPVGDGSTSATIQASLIVNGQPWASFSSTPGKFNP